MARGVEWAAGFFEGEGNVRCGVRKGDGTNYGTLTLQLSQKDREPLDYFQEIVGGRVRGPYHTKDKRFCYFQWGATGKLADDIMILLEPYLSERRLAQLAKARKEVALLKSDKRKYKEYTRRKI